jgi:MFS family permease
VPRRSASPHWGDRARRPVVPLGGAGRRVVAQAASAAVLQGLPGLAPQLRDEYGLSLAGLGVLLASVTVGLLSTLVLWGALADRYGERRVMTAACCSPSARSSRRRAPPRSPADGVPRRGRRRRQQRQRRVRAGVLGWFPPEQRGFAMGVRQTALPLGAGIGRGGAAAAGRRRDLDAAFLLLAAGCLVGALVVLGSCARHRSSRSASPAGCRRCATAASGGWGRCRGCWSSRSSPSSRSSWVYLVDEHQVPVAVAALLLAGVQLGGGLGRIVAGRWSTGWACAWCPCAGSRRPSPAVRPARPPRGRRRSSRRSCRARRGRRRHSWNGLAFTAVGELAGPGRAGTALGLQNTAVAVGAALTAPLLGVVIERTSWGTGFAVAAAAGLLAVLLLRPLVRLERAPVGSPP